MKKDTLITISCIISISILIGFSCTFIIHSVSCKNSFHCLEGCIEIDYSDSDNTGVKECSHFLLQFYNCYCQINTDISENQYQCTFKYTNENQCTLIFIDVIVILFAIGILCSLACCLCCYREKIVIVTDSRSGKKQHVNSNNGLFSYHYLGNRDNYCV